MVRVKLKRIETSKCSIINIKLSTPIFGLPMVVSYQLPAPSKFGGGVYVREFVVDLSSVL